jgi:hypothetical protein
MANGEDDEIPAFFRAAVTRDSVVSADSLLVAPVLRMDSICSARALSAPGERLEELAEPDLISVIKTSGKASDVFLRSTRPSITPRKSWGAA